jgi:CelD/BcsL family acetyltransferase involved in cellulose biosynthesis
MIEAQIIEAEEPPAMERAEASAAAPAQVCRVTELEELLWSQRSGALSGWEELLDADPTATFFQSPAWCLPWYISYAEQFQPLVLFMSAGAKLVGLAPLAVERHTGRIAFAGDNMSDYRDVAAAPGWRAPLLAELFRVCRAAGANSFRLGPTQPESETLDVVTALANGEGGAKVIRREHPCWRWWLTDGAEAQAALKKKFVHRHLNHYKREGSILFEQIEAGEWASFRTEFYEWHTLRQLQAARQPSFNEERKREFHDRMLQDYPASVYVGRLSVGGRFLAAHYGFLWRDVLYWGAPTFDITEEKHSPGQILAAMFIANAERARLRGIDFTLGTEEYKKRFSTECVALPSADLYFRGTAFYARRMRDAAVHAAKRTAVMISGGSRWENFTRSGERALGRARKVRALGVKNSAAKLARRAAGKIGGSTKGLIFFAGPTDVRDVSPRLKPGESCVFHTDELRDLARWERMEPAVLNELARIVRGLPELIRKGHSLHTVLVNGQLAGWGWSYRPESPAFISETETTLAFEPNSVSLYDYQVLHEYRGRQIYPALLSQILRERFAEGAAGAYIMCLESNIASRKGIERAGFRLHRIDSFSRLLRRKTWKQQDVRTEAPPAV